MIAISRLAFISAVSLVDAHGGCTMKEHNGECTQCGDCPQQDGGAIKFSGCTIHLYGNETPSANKEKRCLNQTKETWVGTCTGSNGAERCEDAWYDCKVGYVMHLPNGQKATAYEARCENSSTALYYGPDCVLDTTTCKVPNSIDFPTADFATGNPAGQDIEVGYDIDLKCKSSHVHGVNGPGLVDGHFPYIQDVAIICIKEGDNDPEFYIKDSDGSSDTKYTGDNVCPWIPGCMDSNANNFNTQATLGDGSCQHGVCAGCAHPCPGSCRSELGCEDTVIGEDPSCAIFDGFPYCNPTSQICEARDHACPTSNADCITDAQCTSTTGELRCPCDSTTVKVPANGMCIPKACGKRNSSGICTMYDDGKCEWAGTPPKCQSKKSVDGVGESNESTMSASWLAAAFFFPLCCLAALCCCCCFAYRKKKDQQAAAAAEDLDPKIEGSHCKQRYGPVTNSTDAAFRMEQGGSTSVQIFRPPQASNARYGSNPRTPHQTSQTEEVLRKQGYTTDPSVQGYGGSTFQETRKYQTRQPGTHSTHNTNQRAFE